jgi:4'-phosphopantetheinyl transferase
MELLDEGVENVKFDWCVPPAHMDLADNTFHLWGVNMDKVSAHLEGLRKTLPADEQANAARFRFLSDRNDYIATRGVLRDILSRYDRRTAADLEFCYGPHGKPGLVAQSNRLGLYFNVSHSDRLGLYAVTRAGEVGIDVERVKPCEGFESIANRFFSPPEIQGLRAYPTPLQLKAFLGYWTRKEAYAKALGAGLWLDWTTFDVSHVPRQGVQDLAQNRTRWSICPFVPAPSYVAALAYQGDGSALKFWKWSSLAPASRPN